MARPAAQAARAQVTSKTTSYRLPVAAPDAVFNLQWQTIRDAKAKDKSETKGCAR
jgi:hypothetical protein